METNKKLYCFSKLICCSGQIQYNMKKLAIIGASYLQLPLVKKAKEMGIETHCFAWEEGAVCKEISDYFYPISILDKEAIFTICKQIPIDGITTIATDMAVPTIAFVAEKLGLVSNSLDSALLSTNKFWMREALAKASCSIPKYFAVEINQSVDSLDLNFPIIVKPVDRSGSRGVNKIEHSSGLEQSISLALSESFVKRAIIEEYIEGDEVSVETISWKGKHYILAITDKVTTGSPHFVELAHHQPSTLSKAVQEKIEILTKKALDALQIENGASHSEFKITPNGEVYVIEIGARMGGDFIGSHLVKLSTGYDFLSGVIQISLNQFEVPIVQNKYCSGVYFLCEETKKLLPYFETNSDFILEKEITSKQLKSITNSNDRSGYLIYQSQQRKELL